MMRSDTIIDKLSIIIAVIIGIVIFGKIFGIMPDYSAGEKSGYITSFTHKGIMIKTYEGEMNMGGMRKETDAEGKIHIVPNTFKFTVTDESLINDLKHKTEEGEFVTLNYSAWLVHPWYYDSPYIIKEIVK